MAFTHAPGRHRRPGKVKRTTSRAAGVAALTTSGVVGGLALPALAAPSEKVGLSPVVSIGDAVAAQIDAQAEAQHLAAIEAEQEKAEAAARKEAAAKAAKAAAKAEKERRAKERARRAEAERKRLTTYVSPIAGSYVSTAYRAGGAVWSSGSHTGIDFHAASGTPVRSVGHGTVVEAGWGGAYGNNVVIRMHDGTYTQYGHLSSISVSVGQTVEAGRQIGLSGATGNVTGAHLHFEARTSAEYGSDIDPVAYLRSHGVEI
jgi:murein DD-endopeptidase MepM/ murein hydrolase activator NlpD